MRDKIITISSLLLILFGLYGLHNDWTLYVLVIPFGWIIIGVFLDFFVNVKGTKKSGIISILCALILTNVVLILFHRDTPFVIGRLLCCFGAVILIIRTCVES